MEGVTGFCNCLFPCPKHPARSSTKHLNFYCINKNNSHAARLRLVSYCYFLLFTCCDVICDLLQHRKGKCNILFNGNAENCFGLFLKERAVLS